MSNFGFEGFNSGGGLLFDTSVMYSKLLGSTTLTFEGFHAYSTTIPVPGLQSSGGTPFTFFRSIAGYSGNGNFNVGYNTPNVQISGDSIIISYDTNTICYPDDVAGTLYIGGLILYYGIYYGPHDL